MLWNIYRYSNIKLSKVLGVGVRCGPAGFSRFSRRVLETHSRKLCLVRSWVKVALWDVYCVNGCGSFRLGYVGVGFGGVTKPRK
jgi:hypothetical protein